MLASLLASFLRPRRGRLLLAACCCLLRQAGRGWSTNDDSVSLTQCALGWVGKEPIHRAGE